MTNILSDISSRLSAVEAAVFGRAGSTLAAGYDRRLSKRQLAMMRGVCTRTIDRHVKAGLLPPPEVENGRDYWWISKLQEHDRERANAHRECRHR